MSYTGASYRKCRISVCLKSEPVLISAYFHVVVFRIKNVCYDRQSGSPTVTFNATQIV